MPNSLIKTSYRSSRLRFRKRTKAAHKSAREPFLAATLEQQLEREARRFFADPRHLMVDTARGVLRLSEILRFYPEDFLKAAPSLIAYVNRYREVKVPDGYAIEYIPYDWTINRQPR